MSNAIVLLGRILLSAVFILAGFSKFGDIAGTAGYFASLGMPAPTAMVWLSGLFEIIAGILVLVGFQTVIAAYALAAFSVFAAFTGHFGQGGDDPMLVLMNQQAFVKNLAMAGGFLILAVHGPGSISVDARRG